MIINGFANHELGGQIPLRINNGHHYLLGQPKITKRVGWAKDDVANYL